ncbi:hypothetical protein ASPZODRAFT_77839, partial [Penicilliopsis zonata CBS 506.65]
WRQMCDELPRSLDSLAQDKAIKKDIIEDVQNFLSKDKLGIAYWRGYLYFGEPGTGKTSCCKAVATHFGLLMYVINLPAVDDYGLQELFRTLPAYPARSMVILEDIDAAGIERRDHTANEEDDGSQKGITLTTVLATLDGIGSHASHILIVTTNAKAKLDAALTRPGRIDRQFEFGNPDPATIAAYFSFFFDKCTSKNSSDMTLDQLAVEFSGAVSYLALSPAKLQEYFMRCKDPAIAIKNVATLAYTV